MSFEIKTRDTEPAFEATLTDENDAPVNLTGATVRLLIRGRSGLLINEAMDVPDPANGSVRYEWQSGETDTEGVYEGEVEVTYAGGSKQTFPTAGYFTVIIGFDLDEAS